MRAFLAVAALALVAQDATAAPTQASTPTPTAASVLAANHAAVGPLPISGAARFEYILTESGLTGPQIDHFDLSSGAYVETEQAGPIGDATGFDGNVPWQRDFSGANTLQLGGDRVQTAVNTAYRLANLWWRPDRGGAVITDAGREIVAGRALDHLIVTPRGGKRFDAWFDADTHLLAKTLEDQQFLHVAVTYGDDRSENGLMLAHRIVHDPGLGQAATAVSTLTDASFGPAQPLSTYACPTAPPTGASIEGGAASTTVPFRLLNNHVYVQAFVDGKGPYTFIVDTGGHTLLSPHLVKEVGLKAVGEAVTSGAGDDHSTTGFVHFDEIAIGGVRLRDEIGFATVVYDKSIEGIPVDGMIGFELIRRMVTQIDYGRHTITFSDPALFQPKDLGVAVPFVFYDHLPDVKGWVDGLPARFDIDTGSRTELDLTSPFVAAHDLRAEFPKGTSAVTGWGVGGPARAYMVRLPSIKLGSVQIGGIAAGLSEAKGGSFADPNYEGNVGSALLKRFVVTFDYAHEVMYLKRITPTPPDVGTFDRSGLWINAKAGGFTVVDVAKGSAAADAGIAVGDVITAIDGAPAHEEGLSEARLLLRSRPAGTKVDLIVQQGSESRPVTLILRDQI
jgi:predicted aspartyl protease